jgi:HEAT repeat protein
MANAAPKEQRWDRKQALEALARLGTPQAWDAIAAIARGKAFMLRAAPQNVGTEDNEPLRAYAVLLIGENADAAFVPTLLELVSTASEDLRGASLRALGFFHDPRANQALFEKLHSTSAADRVNAILGLKNLESPTAMPALMAMLNDPEPKVRQVANFALESLTGRKLNLSPNASGTEAARIGQRWHTWWRENAGHFVPARQPACHDW